jgi:putative FmdB family regulatory protein
MPTYTFRCLRCRAVFERQRTIAERNDVEMCPRCNGDDNYGLLKRIPDAPVGRVQDGTPRFYK